MENNYEVKLIKPKNAEIVWVFDKPISHHISWSGVYWNGLSKYPEVEKLNDRIDGLENKYYGCLICGHEYRKNDEHLENHHLISNTQAIHPTLRRLLDVQICVCQTCHGPWGSGWLHDLKDRF